MRPSLFELLLGIPVNERKIRPLAALEAKARQLMMMVGFGFIAYTGGTILSVALMERLKVRLVAANSGLLNLAAVILVGQLWILFVLPALIHLAARFLELPLWRTAIVGALTGTLFNAAVRFVSSGLEQTFSDPLQNAVWLGTVVSGTVFAVWAGRQGRAWAEARQKIAEQDALARKGQYDQFLAESAALVDRRDATRIQAVPSAVETPAPTDPKPPT